jgi:ribonuclease VapC
MIVVDTSALLALIFKEDGYLRVAPMLPQSCMSTINLAEVITRLVAHGRRPTEALEQCRRMPIEWVPFGVEEARDAAALSPKTQSHGLSLADRACLALARVRGIPVMTADRVWRKLRLGITVELIR